VKSEVLAAALALVTVGTQAHAQTQTQAQTQMQTQAQMLTLTLAKAKTPEEGFLVADPKYGMEAGVLTGRSLTRVAFEYERALPPWVTTSSDEGLPPTWLGLLARVAKTTFLDVPIATSASAAIHEVFGHGARGREFDRDPSYSFALPEPYGYFFGLGGHHATTNFGKSGDNDRDKDLAETAGGTEANFLTAHVVDVDMVRRDGLVHHSDLILYFSKLVYLPSIYDSRLLTRGALDAGDDIDSYVTLLQDRFNRFRPSDRTAIVNRLRTAYVWNLADPTLVWAAYATAVDVLWRGKREARAPLPHVGDMTFYMTPRFDLSPFGAEHYLDVMLAKKSAVLDVYGRVGSSGLASYTGAGVRALHVPLSMLGARTSWTERVNVGAELDAWDQPQMMVGVRNAYARPNVFGANGGVTADARVVSGLGITARIAYKTSGFLTGAPLEEGVHGWAGISWTTQP
jgi:hypothetical protein